MQSRIFIVFEYILCYDLFINKGEVIIMAVSYKKLWKLLIDKDMKKKDLRKAAGISTASMAKLGKNENVNTDILVKVCKALNCDISDIMELSNIDENTPK